MDYSSSCDDFDEDSSNDAVSASMDCKVTNRQVVPTAAGGQSTSGLGRAAALGMDVGVVEESVRPTERKKKESSASLYAANVKKNILGLVKKTKESYEKRKSQRKIHHKRMPSEDDLFSTNAIASQGSHGKSLVNKLGMAAEPASFRSQSHVSPAGHQSERHSAGSCPGALDVLHRSDSQCGLSTKQNELKTKNTVDASLHFREVGSDQHSDLRDADSSVVSNDKQTPMDTSEVGSNEHSKNLEPTTQEEDPLQETTPSSTSTPDDRSGQKFCLDSFWPGTN